MSAWCGVVGVVEGYRRFLVVEHVEHLLNSCLAVEPGNAYSTLTLIAVPREDPHSPNTQTKLVGQKDEGEKYSEARSYPNP